MSFNITLPVGMELMDWAVQFVTATGLSGYNVPTPYGFDNWQPWADSLCKALQA